MWFAVASFADMQHTLCNSFIKYEKPTTNVLYATYRFITYNDMPKDLRKNCYKRFLQIRASRRQFKQQKCLSSNGTVSVKWKFNPKCLKKTVKSHLEGSWWRQSDCTLLRDRWRSAFFTFSSFSITLVTCQGGLRLLRLPMWSIRCSVCGCCGLKSQINDDIARVSHSFQVCGNCPCVFSRLNAITL